MTPDPSLKRTSPGKPGLTAYVKVGGGQWEIAAQLPQRTETAKTSIRRKKSARVKTGEVMNKFSFLKSCALERWG
ncbi:hypothetical protein FACS189475_03670 [Betaproteobacteria bacterium]|nr:hypothetical protein FACS189475_03670 [Betaproteobacteria bacterium]